MTMRQTVATGGGVGLAISGVVLALLWRYGIWQVMVGRTDLRAVLWPSSVMVPVTWSSTIPGILTTIFSVAINCLIYITVALLLRASIRALKPDGETGS
jgi:hypothetical protein